MEGHWSIERSGTWGRALATVIGDWDNAEDAKHVIIILEMKMAAVVSPSPHVV
jgi:hypothetical protein